MSNQKNNLQMYRFGKGLQIKDVARGIGIGEASYRRKEQGLTEFSLPEALRLEKVLGISVYEIYEKLRSWYKAE